ncbi:MAG: hypothetical protein WAW88_09815, partial [Nocardioides sp.]
MQAVRQIRRVVLGGALALVMVLGATAVSTGDAGRRTASRPASPATAASPQAAAALPTLAAPSAAPAAPSAAPSST